MAEYKGPYNRYEQAFNKTVDSVADLRAGSFPENLDRLWLSGYYGVGTSGGGALYRDSDDTTTADNGGTVFVDADGVRWKREIWDNVLRTYWFGVEKTEDPTVVPSGDATSQINAICDLAESENKSVLVNRGGYLISGDGVRIPDRVHFFGESNGPDEGTVFYADTTTTDVVATKGDVSVNHGFSLIGNFVIKGEGNATNGLHLMFFGNNSRAFNIRINGCTNNFHVEKGYYASFSNIQCRFAGDRNFFVNGDETLTDSNNGCQGLAFYSCFANDSGGNSVDVAGFGQANSFYNCTFEKSDEESNVHRGRVNGTAYYNCYWEGNGRTLTGPKDVYLGFESSSSGSVEIHGGFFKSAGNGNGGHFIYAEQAEALSISGIPYFTWSGAGTRPIAFVYSRAQKTEIGQYRSDFSISGPNFNIVNDSDQAPRLFDNHMAHAVIASDLSLSSNVDTLLPIERGDYDASFEIGSNKYTAKTPGYHKINATAFFQSSTADDGLFVWITRNGSKVREERDNSIGDNQSLSLSCTLLLDEGDEVEVYVKNNTSADSIRSGSAFTWVEIARVN